jgi:hypothetical protein
MTVRTTLPTVRKVCVFCGSSPGARPTYADAADELAGLLVEQGLGLVYGGTSVGLMGRLADAVLERGGEVTGVIPLELVDREIAHPGLSDLRVVDSMHERKALMAELSDAFVALPGGLGTLEELFEIYTWAQLGLHRKPCALLNVASYYDGVADFLDHAVRERFVRSEHRALLITEENPRRLLERLRSFDPGTARAKRIAP